MAFEACVGVEYISANPLVFFIHVCLVVLMAVDTTKYPIIGGVGMAIRASGPFSLVLPAVYREIFAVMVKGGGDPGILGMAGFAIRGEAGYDMRRVDRLVVIVLVAPETAVGSVVVIPGVANGAIVTQGCMGTGQDIIIIMVGKRGRFPFGLGSMTKLTIRGNCVSEMIGIGCLVIIGIMAIDTNG